jgi:hypothetical protein
MGNLAKSLLAIFDVNFKGKAYERFGIRLIISKENDYCPI